MKVLANEDSLPSIPLPVERHIPLHSNTVKLSVEALTDDRLTAYAVRLFAALAGMTSESTLTRSVAITATDLGEMLNMNRKTVNKAVKELEIEGYIGREIVSGQPTVYYLKVPL